MRNAILVGSQVVNTDLIETIEFINGDAEVGTTIYMNGGYAALALESDSPEAKALRWWFTRADRQAFVLPGETIDIVAMHQAHLEAKAAIDGSGRSMLRAYRETATTPVAEAVVGTWEGEGGAITRAEQDAAYAAQVREHAACNNGKGGAA